MSFATMELEHPNSWRFNAPPIQQKLIAALKKAVLRYSSRPTHLLHFVPIGNEGWCGVFGDPENGCYEWFIWDDRGTLSHSDCSYGIPECALRDVLNEVHPK